jgi:peptide/nickel transport system substrate-binding protein
VPSPLEGTASRFRSRNLSRRAFLILAGSGSSVLLLAACRGGAPAEPPPASTQPPLAARTMAPIVQPQGTAAPAAAKPEPTAAPVISRGGPKGRFSEGFNASLSPVWLDPQEAQPQATPYNFLYALHDALVKQMPGKEFAPSLAESYEIAPDFKSATFKLRPGIKFHDDSEVTPDDVKFSYENYRGANSTVLKAKLDRIDLSDDRTVRFYFKEPFLDFLMIYGGNASGAGWIVPKAYYERVGKDGFKNAPIGAGPYRFVKQTAGTDLELEAFADYWRKVPSVKTVVIKGVSEVATRVAMLKTGDLDVAVQVQGDLLETVKRDSGLRLTAVKSGPSWLEMMGLDRPDHPLADVRVRQAVSLAIDRQAINEAEIGGLSPIEGNWVPEDYQGAISRPVPPTDLVTARKLMAEAGVADGFEISALTPLPPFFSWGERIITQLRALNIKTQLNTMERGAFYERLAPGPNRLKGLVWMISGAPGDAAVRIRESAVCKGAFSGLCLPEVDDRMKAYDSSADPQQRQQLLTEVQNYLLDQYIMVPVCRNVFISVFGPRVLNKPDEISGAIPQWIWVGPFEDIQVKDA